LKHAWEQVFQLEREKQATLVSLWPTAIADAVRGPFRQALEHSWADEHEPNGRFRITPPWPHVTLAQAHQWLWLDETERVLTTLQWFWRHQDSPGLYSLWSMQDGCDTLHLWNTVRTTYQPLHVAPHYWSTAQMVLLQLDMLAYDDPAASTPTVVIGAGVPAAWLRRPVTVKGLSLRSGLLDWSWDGRRLRATAEGPVGIRLGSAFPQGTPVILTVRGGKKTP
jgi:hypothetical protein